MLACLLLTARFAGAQALDWAHSYGGATIDAGYAVVEDAAGNVYSAGLFSSSVDFDPGPGTLLLQGDGFADAYVTKMDSAGNLLWAVEAGGPGNDQALHLVLDGQGNVLVMGNFEGTVDFDPGPGVYALASGGNGQVPFVWKLDSNGNLVWVVAFTGTVGGISFHLAVDPAGNVALAGYFVGTVNFGPVTYISVALSWDIFVAKISNTGTVMWAKQLGSGGHDSGYGVAMDAQSNVYFGGGFEDVVDFDPGPGVHLDTAIANGAAYLCKLDSMGDLVWVQTMDPVGDGALTYVVTCNAQGDVFASGILSGTVDMDPGPGTIMLVDSGQGTSFIGRWDSAGHIVWAGALGGDSTTWVNGLRIDSQDNAYFAGYFNGTADFDPGPGSDSYTSQQKDIFIGKWDAAGNHVFAQQYGGNGNDRGYDFNGYGDHAYAISRFENTVDFDPGAGVHNLSSNGGADVAIQKFILCHPTDTTLAISACDSIVAPSGAVYYSSGTYLDVIPNARGCDSLIHLILSIQPVQATLSQLGNALTAAPAGASYQWVDCENGIILIPGATQQTFTPTQSGNYAVIVTVNGCPDTSACTAVTIVGMEDPLSGGLRLSPNPAGNTVLLHIPADIAPQSFHITDMAGRVQVAGRIEGRETLIDIGNLSPGIYMVSLEGGPGRTVLFVKE